ncbi:MAG: ComF family protein [Ruminococcaceae bacterium]|nr:ComF family protein [Oscillospiraceae bacterium]
MWIKRYFTHLLSLFFPDRCLFCDEVIKHRGDGLCICDDCRKKQTFLEQVHTCAFCGCPLSSDDRLCNTCQTHTHFFDRAVSCMTYENEIRTAILKFKFYHRIDLYRPMAAFMYRRVLPLHKESPFDLVVCAPQTKTSHVERGYNQAHLLAKQLAKDLMLPYIKEAFLKIKETPKQSTLSYRERMKNVEHAFKLNTPIPSLRGKRIILVDDVLTTGATADSLSKHLKRAGAKYVLILTMTTTEKDRLKKLTAEDIAEITF